MNASDFYSSKYDQRLYETVSDAAKARGFKVEPGDSGMGFGRRDISFVIIPAPEEGEVGLIHAISSVLSPEITILDMDYDQSSDGKFILYMSYPAERYFNDDE